MAKLEVAKMCTNFAFANGKILSFELPTAIFISYFLINLRNNIARRYRKMFPINMDTFCHFKICHNRRNHLWKQCRSSLLLSLCKVLNWPKVRLQSWAWSSLALFGISTKIFSRLQWYDLQVVTHFVASLIFGAFHSFIF